MALMAAHGEITPMPDCAIFADTQSEPSAVYRHLDWLEGKLPFPVYRVTAGSLREAILAAMAGDRPDRCPAPLLHPSGRHAAPPMHPGPQNSAHQEEVRELLGVTRGRRVRAGVSVEQWIGISTDEAARMKPSQFAISSIAGR